MFDLCQHTKFSALLHFLMVAPRYLNNAYYKDSFQTQILYYLSHCKVPRKSRYLCCMYSQEDWLD